MALPMYCSNPYLYPFSYPYSYSHYPGAIHSNAPTRSLLITAVQTTFLIDDAVLMAQFQEFGDVRALHTLTLPYGYFTVHYFDFRDAQRAFAAIRSRYFELYHLLPSPPYWAYYILSPPNPPNHGSIVVFNLDSTVSSCMLREIFQRFGAIKECRHTPAKWSHRFVEFYDVRDAAKALEEMNGKEICGRTVVIEFSRPGGRCKNFYEASSSSAPSTSASYDYYNYDHAEPQPLNNVDFPLPPPPSNPKADQEPLKEGKDDSQFQIKDDDGGEAESDARDPRTTLMIKNIPNKYRLKQLLEMLDKHCIECNEKIGEGNDQPASSYDFVYLPVDFNNKCNLGYGFVNMTSPEAAKRFHKAFHLQRWEVLNSRKICEITYARIQGMKALREKFKNSRLLHNVTKMEYMPVVFRPARDGRQVTEPRTMVSDSDSNETLSWDLPARARTVDSILIVRRRSTDENQITMETFLFEIQRRLTKKLG